MGRRSGFVPLRFHRAVLTSRADAFDFFTTPTATTLDPQDEDDLPSTTPNTPKRTTPAPPALGPDGLPVKKKRRTAAEMIGPDGKKLPRIRGPRKKK